jgi:hypothetical protein
VTKTTKLTKKIEAFLKDRRCSKDGLAPVEKIDMLQLDGIVRDLIKAKFETGHLGNLPVMVTLTDHTREESMGFASIPRLAKVPAEARIEVLGHLVFNVKVAVDALSLFQKLQYYDQSASAPGNGVIKSRAKAKR